ncbi:hypothetical protein E2C01_052615 [Portunus trituberculatus]|uniref:Uncharacterized protein n=1 Tax=Portunus trituberculatus TaxID=210409 RepID=A0A5B7GNQ2_PORTR|nr:hypothetical protein [Portunus trituberculatus]
MRRGKARPAAPKGADKGSRDPPIRLKRYPVNMSFVAGLSSPYEDILHRLTLDLWKAAWVLQRGRRPRRERGAASRRRGEEEEEEEEEKEEEEEASAVWSALYYLAK